jgi:hypothetical protein
MKFAQVIALAFLVFSSSENATARSDNSRIEKPQKREKITETTKTVDDGSSGGGSSSSSSGTPSAATIASCLAIKTSCMTQCRREYSSKAYNCLVNCDDAYESCVGR